LSCCQDPRRVTVGSILAPNFQHGSFLSDFWRLFSREGLRPRVLFVRSGFSPPPGVGPRRGGGFFCRKNTVFLKRRLKNTCVLALWPLSRCPWESRFRRYLRHSRPLWLSLGKAWRVDLDAIYVIPALFGHLGKGLESRFRRYLRHSRLLWVSLGKTWRVGFDAIYVIPALFGYLWEGWDSRFRRYLRHSRPLWASLGKAWRAGLDAIYGIPALFGHLWARL